MIVKQGLLGWIKIISYGVYIKLKQRKGVLYNEKWFTFEKHLTCEWQGYNSRSV